MQDSRSTENRAMRSPRRSRRYAATVDPHYYDTDRILARQRSRNRTHITRDANGRPFGQPISDLPSPISYLPSPISHLPSPIMITKTTVTSTATVISAARLRQWAIVENQGSVDMYVAYDGSIPTGPAGASPGTLVAAGTKESLTGPLGDVIKAIVSSGTTTAVVQEI